MGISLRHFKLLLYLFAIVIYGSLISCSGIRDQLNSPYTVLHGATVFDGNGNKLDRCTILIHNGKIQSIGKDSIIIPEMAEFIDLGGKYVMPGMVDAHVHYFQTGFFDARPDAVDLRDSLPYDEVIKYQKNNPERYYEAYLRSGVTATYDVGGFPWSIDLQETAENNLDAPHVASSGPLITPAPESRIKILNTVEDQVLVHLGSDEIGIETVRQNCKAGSTGIKIWGLAPDNSDFMSRVKVVADEVKAQENTLIVHATTLRQAKEALKLGTFLLVHSVTDTLIDEEFIRLALSRDVIYTPTLIVSKGYFNTRMAIIGEEFKMNDPNNVVDPKTKSLLNRATNFSGFVDSLQLIQLKEITLARHDESDQIMAENLKKCWEKGIKIAVGTDAGNPGTLHGISIYDELEKMAQAGIPPIELITMATKNGALAMRRENDFGTLEEGKFADLIILEEDPSESISNVRSITHVMRGGKLRPVNKKFDF